jgi:hypothetical protein
VTWFKLKTWFVWVQALKKSVVDAPWPSRVEMQSAGKAFPHLQSTHRQFEPTICLGHRLPIILESFHASAGLASAKRKVQKSLTFDGWSSRAEG